VGHRESTLVGGQCVRGSSTRRWGEARGVILGPSLEEMGVKWGKELLPLARGGTQTLRARRPLLVGREGQRVEGGVVVGSDEFLDR
jgi:hypothetical protein